MSDVRIQISLPCYGGGITAQCSKSVTRLTHVLRDHDIGWNDEYLLHESLVQRARNALVHTFLKTDATHLLFIDSDIQFNALDVIGMLGADKPLVTGAYPRKGINQQNVVDAIERREPDPFGFAASYVVNYLPAKPGDKINVEFGCVPVMEAATGFMLAKREVFEEMAAAMPEIAYTSDEVHVSRGRGETMHAFFDCAIVEGRYLSEDYLFSRRWQQLGGTVWLFLPAKLSHIGSYTYRGDLLRSCPFEAA